MSGVLVVLEQRAGAWNRMSFEALAAGQQLAAKLGVGVSAAVVGDGLQELGAWALDSSSTGKVDAAYAVEHALLKEYTADGYVAALEQLVKKVSPTYVVFPHTYQVRDFAPALATRFGQVLISDVVAIHDGPVFVRQLLQGKLNADYKQTGAGPFFVSVQAGSFRAPEGQDTAVAMET